jgi:hypothetical protein
VSPTLSLDLKSPSIATAEERVALAEEASHHHHSEVKTPET